MSAADCAPAADLPAATAAPQHGRPLFNGGALDVVVHGVALRLLPQRAAYLPAERTLLIADAHFGKAVSFRRLGVPVPRGTTSHMLAVLSMLLAATQARQIVFLGDLLHAARGRAADTLATVAHWRARHCGVALTLVRGNHDTQAGDPPADWDVQVHSGPLQLGGFALSHHPQPVAGAYVLAGHTHPCVVLGGRAHDRLRLPCFHFGAAVGVLPAFGAFTGMHALQRAAGERVYVTAGDAVRALN